MFTGIVEGKGTIVSIEYRGREKRLRLEVPAGLTDVQPGDSINISGTCLTVTEKKGLTIEVDLSSETLQRTVLSGLREGDQINVERALRLADRLGGHIVTGHVDGIGTIIERSGERDFLNLRLRVPKSVSDYVVQKGSIAVDGVSLTVNDCRADEIQLTLIPYTLEKTTLVDKKVGDQVNIEADILGKYVEKMLDRGHGRSKKVDLSFLREHGFIEGE